VAARITDYLTGGGLFNPEMANHDAVRDLLIDARTELAAAHAEQSAAVAQALATVRVPRCVACANIHWRIMHTGRIRTILKWTAVN
jgi:hypothetical protein